MKKIIITVVSIVLLGGIILGLNSCFKKKDNNAEEIRTAVVQRGDMVVKVTETGSVESKTTVQVKSKVGGEIVRLLVKEGDWVRKGELLVELDTTDLMNRLKSTKADLEEAQAKLSTLLAGERPQDIAKSRESLKQAEIKLEDAKIELDRQNGLFNQGFISKQDVDTAQREYELAQSNYNTSSQQLSLILEGAREQDITSARANVMKAEIGYEQAASDLKDATIYAPLSGTILEKDVEEGEKVTSGIGNSGGGTVIFTIGDLSSMRILTKINEVDINKVRIGQDAEITFDAIRGEKYHGWVTDIASLGKTENNIVIYEVLVEIGGVGRGRSDKSDRLDRSNLSDLQSPIKPGMTADVDIIIARKTGVLYVPTEAIVEHAGRKVVFVSKGNKFIPRKIKTGLQDETHVEIIEGLSKGEVVKLKSLPKKEKTESSSRPRMTGPPGMGMGRR